MAYRLTHAGTDGVRFQRTAAATIIPVAGTLFGSVALLIGVGQGLASGWSREAIAFLIGGGFFLTLPWYVIRTMARLQPQEVTFDNATACCYVVGRDRDVTRRGAIPFASIDSFGYTTRTVMNNTSSAIGAASRTVYDVCFYRTDGSVFVLMAGLSSEPRAAAHVATLEQFVQMGKRSTRIALGDLPPRIDCNRTYERTEFRWKAPAPLGMVAFMLLFFACFFGLVATMARMPTGDAMFRTVATAIGGVGVLVALAVLVSMIRARYATMFIRIADHELSCGVERANGEIRKQTTLALDDVAAVATDVSPDTNAHQLTVRTAAYATRVKAIRDRRGDIANWKDALKETWESAMLDAALPRVETGMLPLATLIAFENHVNLELAKRKGVESPFAVGAIDRYGWWSRRQDSAAHLTLFVRLASNEILGVGALFAAGLPIILIGLLLVFRHGPFLPQLSQAMAMLIAVQLGVGALAAWKLYARTPHRVLGAVTGLVTLLRAANFVAPTPSAYAGPLAFAMCVVLALAGARLLMTPEPDPDEPGYR